MNQAPEASHLHGRVNYQIAELKRLRSKLDYTLTQLVGSEEQTGDKIKDIESSIKSKFNDVDSLLIEINTLAEKISNVVGSDSAKGGISGRTAA